MENSICNMFSVATVQQSPLDKPFFTFSAMLRDAEAIPRANTLQDLDIGGNSLFDRPPELCTVLMEDILPSKYGMGNWIDYNHSLDLGDSESFYDLADSEETPVERSATTPDAVRSGFRNLKQRSYKDLVYDALSEVTSGTMSLQDLYDWVERTENTAGRQAKVWKNGIRQALRDNTTFCKTEEFFSRSQKSAHRYSLRAQGQLECLKPTHRVSKRSRRI